MVTDATHLFAGYALCGPALPELLARTSGWNPATLAPGAATGAPIADVRAIVVRRDLEVPVLEVYVATELARYVWETLHGGGDLARRPCGGLARPARGRVVVGASDPVLQAVAHVAPPRPEAALRRRHHRRRRPRPCDRLRAREAWHHKVAVLEKDYIGAGGSGRNTTIIRANYRTP